MKRVLVLDSGMQPIDVVSWMKAMQWLVTGKAEVVEFYEDVEVRSAEQSWKLPSVLRKITSKYRYQGRKVKLSRRNVMSRDGHTCQYCRAKNELTLDHIIPTCKGGKTIWTNVVTACFRCNQKKGPKTLEQAGMKLLSEPVRPRQEYAIAIRLRETDPKDAWYAYLYWNTELTPG